MPLPAGWRFPYAVFDVEGVLLNAHLLAKKTFGRFLEREYRIPAAAALVLYARSPDLTLEEKVRRLFADHQVREGNPQRAVARFEEMLESEPPVVYEGAREVLEALREKGVHLCAAGSGEEQRIRLRLEQVELLPFFEAVAGVEAGPEVCARMEALARRLGLPAADFLRQAIYFTASPREVRELSGKGMAVAGVAHLVPLRVLSDSGAPVVLKYIGQLLYS